MRLRSTNLAVVALLALGCIPLRAAEPAKSASPAASDPRHISNGWNIPSEGYADQPYIVKTDDGAWLCVMTTGVGVEGAGGQHVVSMRSTDQGRTWEKIVPIEPADGPEASYAVLLKVPYGRIYVFYNHNTFLFVAGRVPSSRCPFGRKFAATSLCGSATHFGFWWCLYRSIGTKFSYPIRHGTRCRD